jgi:hypothetical protein
LGGQNSFANNALNDSGQVVGAAESAEGVLHPVLWNTLPRRGRRNIRP